MLPVMVDRFEFVGEGEIRARSYPVSFRKVTFQTADKLELPASSQLL